MTTIILGNLMSPIVLFFILGLVAALVKSDLKFPQALSETLSIYLLIAIGIKGGIELSTQSLDTLVHPVLGALVLGVTIPIATYYICKWLGVDDKNAIALSATYGSVSIVTFGAAIAYLNMLNVTYESYMNAIIVLLESPAIIVSLVMYGMLQKKKESKQSFSTQTVHFIPQPQPFLTKWIDPEVIKESLFGKSVFLMVGSLIIGAVVGKEALPIVQPLFIDMYKSVLILFLLGMGLLAGEKLTELKQFGFKLIVVALLFPPLYGVIGVLIGKWCGLSLGGMMLMGVLAASSSYIAAPAAIRTSIPDANPSIYLGLSLGVTFPFNLIVGLPLYYQIALWMS